MDQGATAFRKRQDTKAVQHFEDAVNADPGNVTAHLYLGTALLMEFVPGLDSSANLQVAEQAKTEFHKILTLDPSNKLALSSLASLAYNQKKVDESRDRNKKVVAVDPYDKEVYYTLGVLAWTEWLPIDRQARVDSGQKQDDPGPIGHTRLRNELRAKWLPVLDEGIRNLEAALRISADYEDAMAYMNLLIRHRADLLDTAEEHRSEMQRADVWQSVSPGTPPGAPRIGEAVAQASLLSQVAPVYPPLAKQARISGKVRSTSGAVGGGRAPAMDL